MRVRPLTTLALLTALAGCGDDVAADASSTSSGATTGTTSASATAVPTTTIGEPGDGTTTTTGATDGAESGDTASASTDATTSSSSTGGTGDTADTAGDTTGTGTTGGPGDPVGAAAPTWLRALDGLNSLAPPRLVALPDGDALAIITGGLYAKQLVLAQGDPDEQVLASLYIAPALARFDGATGALEEARMLAKLGQGTKYGMLVVPREVKQASNGDVLVAGTWAGTAEFFPGTAASKTMIAEMALNGNNLDRAEEPFFFRMTPTGAVTWLIRGKTPSGIQTTWFNYGNGIAALPGDDVVITGEYEQPGFVVGHGTPGAKTLQGGAQGSFFARLGASGSPTWAHRNSARYGAFTPLRGGADGSVYSLLPADATIFADADAPTMTASEPGLKTAALGRIAPGGGLEWTVNVASTGLNPLRSFEVAHGGALLLMGTLSGELLIRDAGGAVKQAQSDVPQGWIAGINDAGQSQWLRTLGTPVSLDGPTLAGDDGVWIVAQISAPFELEIAGQMTSLPALGYGAESTATTLLRIDGDGEVTAAQVLGADLWVDALAWSGPDQGAILLSGAYWCATSKPHVVSDGGDGLTALTAGCDMMPLDDERGYVASIPRAR